MTRPRGHHASEPGRAVRVRHRRRHHGGSRHRVLFPGRGLQQPRRSVVTQKAHMGASAFQLRDYYTATQHVLGSWYAAREDNQGTTTACQRTALVAAPSVGRRGSVAGGLLLLVLVGVGPAHHLSAQTPVPGQISVSVQQGPVGTPVTVTDTGFAPNTAVFLAIRPSTCPPLPRLHRQERPSHLLVRHPHPRRLRRALPRRVRPHPQT